MPKSAERLRRLALMLSGFGLFILILTLQPFSPPAEATTRDS